MDILPGKERQQTAELAATILTGRSLTQLIYLLLNEVLPTDLVFEYISDPTADTIYQFLPAIDLQGFTTLEDLEIYDNCSYNIQTGERHPPDFNPERIPRRLPLTEIRIDNDMNLDMALG